MSDPLDDPVVQRARALSESAHVGQKRDSGEPYATHPAAVARLLVGYGVADAAVLAAAYLHDVLEDTEVSESALRAEFGGEIVELVAYCDRVERAEIGIEAPVDSAPMVRKQFEIAPKAGK